MKLSKKAREGFEIGIRNVEMCLAQGMTPIKALKKCGIDGMEDTFWFLEYLMMTKREKLVKILTKK